MNGADARPAGGGWAFRAFIAVVHAIVGVLAMLLVIVAVIVGAIVVWLAYALWPAYLLCSLLAAMPRWIWARIRGRGRPQASRPKPQAPNPRPEQLKGISHESSACEDRDQ